MVKGCALRNRANIYVTESCRPTKKVFWVSKEKKNPSRREKACGSERGRGGEKRELPGGVRERGERRRIMKTTMGERARLKLAQFCSRREGRGRRRWRWWWRHNTAFKLNLKCHPPVSYKTAIVSSKARRTLRMSDGRRGEGPRGTERGTSTVERRKLRSRKMQTICYEPRINAS